MFIITIQAFYLSCTNPDTGDPGRKSRFDFEGRSTFILINDTEDSLHIHLSNWYTLPFRLKEFDTLVAPRTRTQFLLVSQNNTYNNLTLSGKKFKIFSIPGSVDSMIVLKEIPPVDVSFSGDLKTINEFLLKKKTKIKSVDADWMPRINATSSAKNLSELITVNDSITQLHIEFLKENAKLIPEWYLHFEKERLKYLNAGVKLNSLNYRKDMLNIKDSVPEISSKLPSIHCQFPTKQCLET